MRAGHSHPLSLKNTPFAHANMSTATVYPPIYSFFTAKKLTGTVMCCGHPWLLQPQQNPTGTTKAPIPHFTHIPVSLGGDLSPGQHNTQTLLTHSLHLKCSQTLQNSL